LLLRLNCFEYHWEPTTINVMRTNSIPIRINNMRQSQQQQQQQQHDPLFSSSHHQHYHNRRFNNSNGEGVLSQSLGAYYPGRGLMHRSVKQGFNEIWVLWFLFSD
jgi:TnpA family transposase